MAFLNFSALPGQNCSCVFVIVKFLHFFCEFYNTVSLSEDIKCCNNWVAISQINKSLPKYSRHYRMSDDVDIISHTSDWTKASPLPASLFVWRGDANL